MDIFLISVIAMLASFMTFMSGFGLGTLLLPVFALYFPLQIAIAMTAAVHLMNNIFKTFLMKKHIDWKIFLVFGLPSIIFAFLGAMMLNELLKLDIEISYSLFQMKLITSPIKITIASVIIFFAIFDLVPRLHNMTFEKKYLPLGGALSGFFGGLSGHQGAIRSTFLIKANLTKEVYIATGIFIAVFVDIARITIYGTGRVTNGIGQNWEMLVAAIVAAFVGSVIGKFYLKKVTIKFVRILLGIFLILVSIAIGTGII